MTTTAARKKTEFRERLEAAKHASTLQLLFKAARLLNERALERVADKPGRPILRPSHTALFPHIDRGGTRITELAKRIGITKQAVSQLVDDLEKIGVVERVADPDDQRARRVIFTDRGKRGLLDGLEILTSLEQDLRVAIGTERVDGLRESLVAILAMLEATPARVKQG
jgi:DNA-binding MarR family transcriptional regulator